MSDNIPQEYGGRTTREFCGDMNQTSKALIMPQVLVHFETDFSRSSKGFSAKVSFIISRHSNSILQPGGYYPNNLHTATRIVAPQGSR